MLLDSVKRTGYINPPAQIVVGHAEEFMPQS